VKTARQIRGTAAEDIAVSYLLGLGWTFVARNVKVGAHDEIDVVAVDPGPPPDLVCVEVRSSRSPAFGSPEERIDQRKMASLYRAARAFVSSGLAPELQVGARNVRVDLVVVDLRTSPAQIRHWRAVRRD
jgi:putative endonuclease